MKAHKSKQNSTALMHIKSFYENDQKNKKMRRLENKVGQQVKVT